MLTFPGEKLGFALSDWTSWHIGGQAERFFMPNSIDMLAEYLKCLPVALPITWLGLGSNVLIRDGGITGSVVCTRDLDELFQDKEGNIVASAGVTCAKLARFACKLGFPDAGFFAGIPGTVGGALRMNAGAFGGETWEWVDSVEMIKRSGERIWRQNHEFDVAYRHVRNQVDEHEAFVTGRFRFPKKENIDGLEQIKALLRKRKSTQPIGSFNCGSVYRNPPGEFAAKLIETCGLKGYQVGDAQISKKHANFIINLGNASAKDVERVMTTIEDTVKAQFGISLIPEVKIIGEPGEIVK